MSKLDPTKRLQAFTELSKAAIALNDYDKLIDDLIAGELDIKELSKKQWALRDRIKYHRDRAEMIDPTAKLSMFYN
mgnify:CR=1 FL=1